MYIYDVVYKICRINGSKNWFSEAHTEHTAQHRTHREQHSREGPREFFKFLDTTEEQTSSKYDGKSHNSLPYMLKKR